MMGKKQTRPGAGLEYVKTGHWVKSALLPYHQDAVQAVHNAVFLVLSSLNMKKKSLDLTFLELLLGLDTCKLAIRL